MEKSKLKFSNDTQHVFDANKFFKCNKIKWLTLVYYQMASNIKLLEISYYYKTIEVKDALSDQIIWDELKKRKKKSTITQNTPRFV